MYLMTYNLIVLNNQAYFSFNLKIDDIFTWELLMRYLLNYNEIYI